MHAQDYILGDALHTVTNLRKLEIHQPSAHLLGCIARLTAPLRVLHLVYVEDALRECVAEVVKARPALTQLIVTYHSSHGIDDATCLVHVSLPASSVVARLCGWLVDTAPGCALLVQSLREFKEKRPESAHRFDSD